MGLLTRHLIDARIGRIEPYLEGAVLDLGCGPADLYRRFGDRIERYCGVDMSPELVEADREEFPECRFEVRDLDDDLLDLGETFDRVLMIALVEHLFNQKHVMTQVASVLRPGGLVVLTTPTPFGNDVVHRAGSRVGLFATAAMVDHVVLYNRYRLGLLAQECGLEMTRHRYFQLRCNQVATLQKPVEAAA